MEVHDVCKIFPMMSDDEFSGLKADIAANGQREPIWTYQGKIIDGRNRFKACEELGVTPKLREWDGTGSLTEFVVSLNLHRRHLTSSQRAACGVDVMEWLQAEAKERQKIGGTEGGKRSGEARRQKAEASNPTPRLIACEEAKVIQRVEEPSARSANANTSSEQAANFVGSNRQYIQDAKTIKAASPELHEKVKTGEITLPQAKREVARRST